MATVALEIAYLIGIAQLLSRAQGIPAARSGVSTCSLGGSLITPWLMRTIDVAVLAAIAPIATNLVLPLTAAASACTQALSCCLIGCCVFTAGTLRYLAAMATVPFAM
jgi:hypothetical protein